MARTFCYFTSMKKIEIALLLIALLLGTYFRFKNIGYDLIFNYDTARDILVVRDIVVNHKITLLGPTTAIEGLFVGPLFYYLLVIPFILSGGDPVSGAVMTAIFGIITIFLGYYFVKEIFKSRRLGILSAYFIAFSPLLISYSRFPLNPNQFPMTILLFYLFLYKVGQGKTRYLPVVSFLLGISFNFEISTAIFLLPTIVLYIVWNKIKVTLKNYIISLSVLIATLLPQLFFELRHNFLMTNSLIRYLTTKESFGVMSITFFKERLLYFFDNIKTTLIVREELFRGQNIIIELVIILSLILIIYKSFKLNKEIKAYRLLFAWIFVSILGLLFYKNSIWGWYMIPLFPAFAIMPVILFKHINKYISLLIFGLIIIANSQMWLNPTPQNDKTRWVLLRDQEKAVDYVYTDSKGQPFNAYVYVQYGIDYPYQYLWVWYGQKKYGRVPSKPEEKIFYLIAEPNKAMPDRREGWLKDYLPHGKIVSEVEIDPGILVQKYERN